MRPGTSAPSVRAAFRRFFGFDLRTVIVLLTITALLRILIVPEANATGSYQLVSVSLPLGKRPSPGLKRNLNPTRRAMLQPEIHFLDPGLQHRSFRARERS